MIRRRRYEEGENTHRWLVSYADFITLLFAFFVVMYSISQVNEGKYRVLSDSLLSAFESTPTNTAEPAEQASQSATPTGEGLLEGQPEAVPVTAPKDEQAAQEDLSLPAANAPNEQQKREFSQLYGELEQSLQPLIDAGMVALRGNQDWIEVDMRSGLLFESGSDVLGKAADPIMTELAEKLRDSRNLMRIRGYTDNQAIETERFPSNWELASARAVAVVRKLQSFGIPPARMAVEGFGEFNPIASNNTAEGRARNRRVVLAISRLHEPDKHRDESSGKGAPAAGGERLPADPASRSESATSTSTPATTSTTSPVTNAATATEAEPTEALDVVRLPNGGLLIRGKERNEPAAVPEQQSAPPKPKP
ncbi:flagellar motor protein MotD [Permianibacter sp. IMCC34836]|uniref:flagellar motor protein MotD n=1 Tax=Permianibacter fluminis TaxID=2738515 RepID=UPI00155211F3|nr:flagellar motor protein MotD [Permianibacter fluminis]NQD38013.1 flagellar motor protein MotD [Permianibacter fluminis]